MISDENQYKRRRRDERNQNMEQNVASEVQIDQLSVREYLHHCFRKHQDLIKS